MSAYVSTAVNESMFTSQNTRFPVCCQLPLRPSHSVLVRDLVRRCPAALDRRVNDVRIGLRALGIARRRRVVDDVVDAGLLQQAT